MKKYLKIFVMALIVIVTTSSCSTERRTLSHMNKLATRIEKYGETYTVDEWKAAAIDYQKIKEEEKECNFTSAQREKMGEMEGRCVAGFTRWAGDKVLGVFREGKGIIKGFIEGLKK